LIHIFYYGCYANNLPTIETTQWLTQESIMLMETIGCVQPLTTGNVLKIRVIFHSVP